MSKDLSRHLAHRRGEKPPAHDGDKQLSQQEALALRRMQLEAKRRGCLLTSDGKGGLQPSLVLGVMRKAWFRCKVCGQKGSEKNGGLSVHHKYQHITAPQEREKGERANVEGRRNEPSQIVAICNSCHDKVHQKDRAEHGGDDADQALKDGSADV